MQIRVERPYVRFAVSEHVADNLQRLHMPFRVSIALSNSQHGYQIVLTAVHISAALMSHLENCCNKRKADIYTRFPNIRPKKEVSTGNGEQQTEEGDYERDGLIARKRTQLTSETT